MRTKWSLLAALLCYAAAPAATCDPIDPLSPLSEPDWTLAEPVTMPRALASNSTPQQTTQLTDPTVVLTGPLAVKARSVDKTIAALNALPVTSTAADHGPESGLR